MKPLHKLLTALLVMIVAIGYAQSAGPDQTTCANSLVAMAATGSGVWTCTGPNYVNILNPTSPTTWAGPYYSGTYLMKWTTASGSDTMVVTVLSATLPPAFSISPSQVQKCSHGAMDTFTAIYSAGTNQTFEWRDYFNGAPSQQHGPIYTSAADTVYAVMTCDLGCPAGPTSYLSWYGLYDTIPTPPAPLLSHSGGCPSADTLLLTGGFDDLRFNWYSNGTLMHSENFPASVVGRQRDFYYPRGAYADNSGNLYITDWYYNRVTMYPPGSTDSTYGIVVAGGGANGSGSNQLSYPAYACKDAAGNLYVCDYGNYRVQMFPAGSLYATTVAGGNGSGGATNQVSPVCVQIDAAGYLYVADPPQNRILRFPPNSTSVSTGTVVAGGNGQGHAANQFDFPKALFIDHAGALYVSDVNNMRVQKFPAGSTSATNATTILSGVTALYMDTSDNIYVYDTARQGILKYTAGNVTPGAGMLVAGGHGLGRNINQLPYVDYFCVDLAGNIYIPSYYTTRVVKWSPATFDSVYIPTTPGQYSATVQAINGCESAPSPVTTIAPCLSDSVWPGDADHNGVADNNDLLPLGVGYGLNGFARPDQSIVWSAHYAQDWSMQFLNGENAKHTDCNGDGMINGNDTTAILANFGLTHSKTDGVAAYRSGVPAIRLLYSKDTVQQGDTLTVSLLVGDSALPVSRLYGLAFTYHYDALVVDTTTTAFDFGNSFLATSANGMSISKEFKSQGIIKAAVTGINHVNRSGYGKIAAFIATITTGNINGKDLSYYANINYITDIYAIDKDGDSIALSFVPDSDQVAYEPSGIRELDYTRIKLYPNPAHDVVTVETELPMINEAYILSDITGRAVASGRIRSRTTQISLSDLAPGLYTLRLKDDRTVYKVTKN